MLVDKMAYGSGDYRYVLRRVWNKAKKRLLFIGCNPSTADAYVDDPTIRRLIGFAHRWDCGSLSVVNLFALRSTSPKAIMQCYPHSIGHKNDAWIMRELLMDRDSLILVGWGNHGTYQDRGKQVYSRLKEVGTVLCLGVTRVQAPIHPLYVPYSSSLLLYEPKDGEVSIDEWYRRYKS